jgi:hypothetical protein
MAMHRQTKKPPGMVLESGILDTPGGQWCKAHPVHGLRIHPLNRDFQFDY